jgi:hypothetical protein
MVLEQLIPEEQIKSRSFALWNTAGRPDGRSEEFWFRAVAELENELEHSWLVALEERENLELAMPKLPISKPLQRCEAGKLGLKQAA